MVRKLSGLRRRYEEGDTCVDQIDQVVKGDEGRIGKLRVCCLDDAVENGMEDKGEREKGEEWNCRRDE